MGDKEWRPVVGYETSHMVSSDGDVMRIYKDGTTRVIGGGSSRGGYRTVCLFNGGPKGAMAKHHVLVARCFIGPRPHRAEINHKNGCKTDNRAENLEYVSQSENMRHAYRLGLKKPRAGHFGERNAASRLTAESVTAIRAAAAISHAEMARKYGVSPSQIANIRSGRAWRHLLGADSEVGS